MLSGARVNAHSSGAAPTVANQAAHHPWLTPSAPDMATVCAAVVISLIFHLRLHAAVIQGSQAQTAVSTRA